MQQIEIVSADISLVYGIASKNNEVFVEQMSSSSLLSGCSHQQPAIQAVTATALNNFTHSTQSERNLPIWCPIIFK